MANDPTQAIAAGNANCRIWLADVGTAFPADLGEAFVGTAGWTDIGGLKTPPAPSRAVDKTDIELWNADEPIASVTNSDVSTITLNPVECNRTTFELYFGQLTFDAITGGVHIEPDTSGGDVEKAFCLELVDGIVGGKVLRIGWRRCIVSEVGAMNMDKADVVNFEITLKRLVPADGTTFFIDANLSALVSG